jgi:hypothetical protein
MTNKLEVFGYENPKLEIRFLFNQCVYKAYQLNVNTLESP